MPNGSSSVQRPSQPDRQAWSFRRLPDAVLGNFDSELHVGHCSRRTGHVGVMVQRHSANRNHCFDCAKVYYCSFTHPIQSGSFPMLSIDRECCISAPRAPKPAVHRRPKRLLAAAYERNPSQRASILTLDCRSPYISLISQAINSLSARTKEMARQPHSEHWSGCPPSSRCGRR